MGGVVLELIGAGLLAGGAVAGFVAGWVGRWVWSGRPGRRTGLEYVCDCGHAWSHHDEDEGCHKMEFGGQCSCRRYRGPEPLDPALFGELG
jgi:hypothetical protein